MNHNDVTLMYARSKLIDKLGLDFSDLNLYIFQSIYFVFRNICMLIYSYCATNVDETRICNDSWD